MWVCWEQGRWRSTAALWTPVWCIESPDRRIFAGHAQTRLGSHCWLWSFFTFGYCCLLLINSSCLEQAKLLLRFALQAPPCGYYSCASDQRCIFPILGEWKPFNLSTCPHLCGRGGDIGYIQHSVFNMQYNIPIRPVTFISCIQWTIWLYDYVLYNLFASML